jgi:transcriptional regulator
MYIPESFQIPDVSRCQELMRQFGFATLVTTVPGEVPAISHLPLMLDVDAGPFGTLRGHLARANPHWRSWEAGGASVAIFQGPHGYISPRWYAAEVAVPTWNYATVHAHGQPTIVTDPVALRLHLEALAERYESGPNPWRADDLPPEVYENLSAAIVGFSMPITQLEGKAKLGQNRSAADQAGLLAGLRGTGRPDDAALAEFTVDGVAR